MLLIVALAFTAGCYALFVLTRYRERKRRNAGASPITRQAPGFFTRSFSLADFIGMALSISSVPLFARLLLQPWYRERLEPQSIVVVVVLSVALGPLCFLHAKHRLDANRIPEGRYRVAFLYVYPYLISIPPLVWWSRDSDLDFVRTIIFAGCVLVAGGTIAALAKAHAVKQQPR